jgi:hypothetical protein
MVVLPGKNAGRPTTQRAPRMGPATEPRPPMTTMATRRSESSTWKMRSVSGTFWIEPASMAPARPARPPASAKATSFVRAGATV